MIKFDVRQRKKSEWKSLGPGARGRFSGRHEFNQTFSQKRWRFDAKISILNRQKSQIRVRVWSRFGRWVVEVLVRFSPLVFDGINTGNPLWSNCRSESA